MGGAERGRSGSLSHAICIILVMGVILVLVGAGFLALGYVADQSTSEVNVIIQLSGDDLMVTIVDGVKARHVQILLIYVEGHADAGVTVQNPPIGEPIKFPKMGHGVQGEKFVIVEAGFNDGTEEIVDYVRMSFS